MIQSFADETTVDLFRERNTRHARRIPRDLWRQAQRKLKARDVAARLQDLKVPAGNRLERLKGRRAGQYSMRISDQYPRYVSLGGWPCLRSPRRRLSLEI